MKCVHRCGQMGDGSTGVRNGKAKMVTALRDKRIKRVMTGDRHIAVQCFDASWYMWGFDDYNEITGLCDCLQCDDAKALCVLKPHRIHFKHGVSDHSVVDMHLGWCRSMVVVCK